MTARVQRMIRPGNLSPEKGPTEESLAREFAAIHAEEWRYDHTAHAWYRWDGPRWLRDDRRFITHLFAEHLRIAGEATRTPGIASTKTARGMETFAAADPRISCTADHWDADSWLLGTPSGTVDLRTGAIHPALPAQFITKLSGASPAEGEPVLWLRFLTEATAGDLDMVRFLQRWCGYCLTGCTREHAFAFIYGPGGNGKSVFLNTLAGIMGEYAAVAAMETFADSRSDRHTTELAMLKGARLVTASETEQGRGWAEAKVKAITGGDPITARFMRRDNFTYTPQFKLTIAGNHAPSLRNVDDAMKRRLNMLPFVTRPAQPDRDLETKLRAEWPQILAWMITGCLDWQANGLQRPAAVSGATDGYFADQDLFGQWIDERCNRDPQAWEQPTPLFQSWCEYAREAGEHPNNAKDFKATLERRGIHRAKTGGLKVYRGIALRRASHE